jgi:DinB superfamily
MAHVDLSKLSPSDAVVALRGLERRYRELFEPLPEGESPDDIAQRSGPDGWSVFDHIVAATQAIAAANRTLARVLIAEAPTVRPGEVDRAARPKPAVAAGSLDEAIAELGREAAAAADRIERVPAESWSRTAVVEDGPGRTVTALDIARTAVDAGVSHLRAAQDVLAAVGGRPADPW